MLIKHYVVTYDNVIWEKCVRSILAAPIPAGHEREIWVLNNHTGLMVPADLVNHIRIIQNEGRPNFSTGHLSRSWNQGLLHGFRSLKTPDADLVVLSQNDAEFERDYLFRLIEHHVFYEIITHGEGDNCVSYTPTGVRRVGLWDERFCNIGHQESDYFLRMVKFLGERASINDHQHGRFHHPLPPVTRALPTGHARREPAHLASTPYHGLAHDIFMNKWRNMTGPMFWNQGGDNDPNHAVQAMNNFIFYPYFEHDVETLAEQFYFHLPVVPAPESPDRQN